MTDVQQRTDGELLGEYAATGSQAAFAELVNRHAAMVQAVAWRVLADHHEAQDVTQAVFVTLARKAKSLRRDVSAGGWLHRVAWCLARDVSASRQSRQQRETDAMEQTPLAKLPEVDHRALRAELDGSIEQLPERYRRPLVLFHLEGQTLQQTAAQLGLNPATAGTRLARARELLRQKLVRRGVTVGSVGALTALLSAESGAVVLPPTFVAATVKAATDGAVSTTVAALSKGALHMLFITKVKAVSLTAAACLVVAGTGVVAAKQLAGSSTPAPSETTIMEPATTPVLVAAAPVPVTPVQPPTGTPVPVAPKAAEQPLRFTEADNGKTVTVKLGQPFEVLLLNGREGAGWEPAATEITGASVERVNKLRRGNCDEFMAEKAPTPDTTLGMYKYRYNAVTIGTSIIRLYHLIPSGPVPKARDVTGSLGEFKLIVEVTADGAAATPAVNEYQAQQLAQLWVSGSLAGRVDQVVAVSDVPFGWDKVEVVKTVEELKAKFDGVIKTKDVLNLQVGEATVLKDEEAAQAAERFKMLDTAGLVYVLVKIPNPEKPRESDSVLLAIKPGAELKVVGFSD